MHYKVWSALGNKMNGFSVWPELARVMHKRALYFGYRLSKPV